MKRQIRQAADRYADQVSLQNAKIYHDRSFSAFRDTYSEAFIAGAQWRIKSVWHTAADIPEKDRDCLVKYKDIYKTFSIRIDRHDGQGWKILSHLEKMIRWAYIEDITPHRKEK